MDRISRSVRRMTEKLTGPEAFDEYEAYRIWPEVAGERIAAISEAENIVSGVLYVKVKNPVWRQELSMLKAEILEKYDDHFKKKIVKETLKKDKERQ